MLKSGVRIPRWFQNCLVLCIALAATLAMVQRANAQFTSGTPVSPMLIGQSYWNALPNTVWPVVQASGANPDQRLTLLGDWVGKGLALRRLAWDVDDGSSHEGHLRGQQTIRFGFDGWWFRFRRRGA